MAWQLWSLGVLAHRRGDDARARENFAESLALYRALDDRRGMAESLEGLATIDLRRGETARGNTGTLRRRRAPRWTGRAAWVLRPPRIRAHAGGGESLDGR
jgi:hypothetical protein